MDLFVLSMAALAALVPSPASVGQGSSMGASATAQRSEGGAAVSATISVRIIANSARIGAGPPPAPAMVPRQATIAAADGSAIKALIYDFE